jgi:NTP pyrophosphatase (non-canonical NTP hydrolase)
MISQKLLEQMIHKYGESKQLDIAIEECSELIKAISKYKRDPEDPSRIKSIAEEEADVRIMLEQVDIMMLKHDPDYTKRVKCEMDIKEQRIKTMLGLN